VGGVKTHEARTVRLPRFLCDQLAAYLADRPHGPEDLVFAAPLGGPLRENNFVGRRFRPATQGRGVLSSSSPMFGVVVGVVTCFERFS
jgi:hypothetical protein